MTRTPAIAPSAASCRLISWNVNGLRAAMKKDFLGSLQRLDADVVAIQETKLQSSQLDEPMAQVAGYDSFWSHCEGKKGYSGVAVYSRIPPLRTAAGIGRERFDREGRILELDLGPFILLNVYFPNGQMSPERLQYKLDFYEAFFDYTDGLRRQGRSLVVCGDYNTAHNEIDLANPKANEKTSGFLRIERDWLDRIAARGYVDTFRHSHPDTVRYSWWTYRFKARERNIGWRIDYIFVTEELIANGQVREAFIENDIPGSDHCPVGVVITR
jgi:exodeoxyribonuclease III